MRKLMILCAAIAALALMAVSASAASAAEWKINGTPVGGEAEKVTVTTEGEIELVAENGLAVGPCVVTDHGFIWNEGGVARDLIDKFIIHTPCATNFGCTVVAAATNAEEGWPSHVVGEETDIIENVAFVNVFNEGCEVAPELGATGSVEATWNPAGPGFTFSNSGNLTIPGVGNAFLNGFDNITNQPGLELG